MGSRDERPIVFFDGVCVLCNGFVDRVLRADRQGRLRFAPLEGETAASRLPRLSGDPETWSVFFLDRSGVQRESDAVLAICRSLGGWWRIPAVLRVVPKTWRDALYRSVARRRYRWFGRSEECRSPGDDERFLP